MNHSDYAERFSERYLSDRLKVIFSTVLKGSENIEDEISSLIEELNGFSRKTTIYLQVMGVAVEGKTEIGKIFLIKSDKTVADDLKEKTKQIISTIKNPDDQKAVASELLCAAIDDELLGQTVAACTVNAEPIRAFERAIEETNSVIDVLHFMTKGIIGIPTKVKIGLKGQVVSTIRRGFLLSHNQLNTRADRVGSIKS